MSLSRAVQWPLLCTTRLVVREGAAGNLPDAAAVETARLIDELVQGGGREGDDLLLVLITGGGSALLPFPRPPITLDEKADLVRDLSLAGAPIKELNAVRKRISELKGGRLALKATRSGFRVMGLIISDVVGDPLGLIASGPTVLNGDDPSLAKEIIERWAKTQFLILRKIASHADALRRSLGEGLDGKGADDCEVDPHRAVYSGCPYNQINSRLRPFRVSHGQDDFTINLATLLPAPVGQYCACSVVPADQPSAERT